MLNGKLSNSIFFLRHVVLQAHLCESTVPRPYWRQVLCCPQSRPHQMSGSPPLLSILPGSPESIREGIPEAEVLTHRALQPPAGLACANLFLSASAQVHTGRLGGVCFRTSSRSWLVSARQTDLVCHGVSRLFCFFPLSSPITSVPCMHFSVFLSGGRVLKSCTMLRPPFPVYFWLLSFLWGTFCPSEDFKFCFGLMDLFFFSYEFLKSCV